MIIYCRHKFRAAVKRFECLTSFKRKHRVVRILKLMRERQKGEHSLSTFFHLIHPRACIATSRKKTPVRKDNSRSSLQEATTTRYVVKSTHVILFLLTSRWFRLLHLARWSGKFWRNVSPHSWFLNIDMTPLQPTPTHLLFWVLLYIYIILNPKTYFCCVLFYTLILMWHRKTL